MKTTKDCTNLLQKFSQSITFLILLVTTFLFIVLSGCSNKYVQQKRWQDAKIGDLKARIKIVDSFYSKEDDINSLLVLWQIQNVDKKPILVKWEKQSVVDVKDALFHSTMGNTSIKIKPGQISDIRSTVFGVPSSFIISNFYVGIYDYEKGEWDYRIKIVPNKLSSEEYWSQKYWSQLHESASSPTSTEEDSRFGLEWGSYENLPAKKQIEKCHLVDAFDLAVLYYQYTDNYLTSKEWDSAWTYKDKLVFVFGYYVPSYENAEDEFKRKEAEDDIKTQFEKREKTLASDTLCILVKTQQIGEYDFDRGGFPLYYDRLKEGFKTTQCLKETDNFCIMGLKLDNLTYKEVGIIYTPSYKKIWVDNDFPPFIKINQDKGKLVVDEFGTFKTFEDQLNEMYYTEQYGEKYSQLPRKIINYYAIFTPLKTENEHIDIEDDHFAHGKATCVVFATEAGTVLGVQPNK